MSKEITIKLKDPKAIELVNKIPKEHFDEILEKYIMIGDTVFRYASIMPAEDAIKVMLGPILTELKEKTDTLGILGDQISKVVPILGKTAKKGEISCESIFTNLAANFRDDAFEDVSETGKFTDIKAIPKDKDKSVLVEVKDYTSNVPTEEVEKFWRDMDLRDTQFGIFVSMRTRIAKITDDIKFISKGDKIAIFLVNEKLGWNGHILAYYVIKKIIEARQGVKKKIAGEELLEVLSKLNDKFKKIKDKIQIASDISDTAQELQTHTTKTLSKIIEKATALRTYVDETIEDAFKEMSKTQK